MLQFPGGLRGGSGPERPSRIPRHAKRASCGDVDTCIPSLTELEYFRWLQNIASPTLMWRSRKRANWDIIASIFAQWCEICLHLSSRLDQRPSTELGARRPTRRRAEKRNSVAYSIRLTGAFNLYQYGLTSSQPDDDVEEASRNVVWTVALHLVGFPIMRHMVLRDWTLAKRRNGKEAKERPSHIERAILGRSTCFTDSLLQIVRHTRHRHIREK